MESANNAKAAIKKWTNMETLEKQRIAALLLVQNDGLLGDDLSLSIKSPYVLQVTQEFGLPVVKKHLRVVQCFLKRNVKEIIKLSRERGNEGNLIVRNKCSSIKVSNNITIADIDFVDDCENESVSEDDMTGMKCSTYKEGNQSSGDVIDFVDECEKAESVSEDYRTATISNTSVKPMNYDNVNLEMDLGMILDDPDDVLPVEHLELYNSDDNEMNSKVARQGKNVGVTVTFPVVDEECVKKREDSNRNFTCTGCIGEFIIEKQVWDKIVGENGKLVTELYPTIISDKFYRISKGCIIQMQNVNYIKNARRKRISNAGRRQILTIYAYCGHNKKTSFKLTCYTLPESDDILVLVYTNVQECHHPQKKTRELSGIARETMKHELINNSPMMVRLSCVNQCDPEGVKSNNVQDAKSYSVFRKAKAEALAVDDLHKNPLIDLFLMRDLEEITPETRYLQHVAHPLEVMMYTRDVIDLLEKAKYEHTLKNEFSLHIDATGSVVRKIPQCENKRVLYYAMVFRTQGFVIPAAEYLSCNHTAESIGLWLLKLKSFLIENGNWPPCKRIVSDFSWALINAVMYQWNDMKVVTYLVYCHNKILNKDNLVKPAVTVHLCVCHFVKNVIGYVKTVTSNMRKENMYTIKQFFLQVICTIINCNSYEKIKLICRYTITVLLNEEDCGVVQHALREIGKLCDGRDKIEEIENIEEIDGYTDYQDNTAPRHDNEPKQNDAMYKKSPFYNDIHDIEMSIRKQIDEAQAILNPTVKEKGKTKKNDGEPDKKKNKTPPSNKYYNPQLVHLLVVRYAPYLPLWSGLLLPGSKNNFIFQRFSNGPIENWFHQVKNIVLDNKCNLRPNRFVRKMKDMVMGRCKEISLAIPKEGCARGKLKRPRKQKSNTQKIVTKVQKKGSSVGSRNKMTLKRTQTSESQQDNKLRKKVNDPIVISSESEVDNCEETWRKPQKKAHTYFEKKFIQTQVSEPFTMPPDNVETIKGMILTNYLINDENYYVDLSKMVGKVINYTVCQVDTPSGGKCNVEIDSMNTLKGTKWLCTDIMSAIGYVLLKEDTEKKCVIYHDNIGNDCIRDGRKINRIGFLFRESRIVDTTEKLFFPLNIGQQHWVLAYANIKKNEFTYIDPFGKPADDVLESAFKNFLQFWSDTIKTDVECLNKLWKTTLTAHPKQKDNHNCGVYVMYFIHQLIGNDTISFDFNPYSYRTWCYKHLLSSSRSMENICLICNREFPPHLPPVHHQCVECCACSRWFHVYTCLPKDVPSDLTILSDPNFQFFCYLCQLYYKNHMKKA